MPPSSFCTSFPSELGASSDESDSLDANSSIFFASLQRQAIIQIIEIEMSSIQSEMRGS